jgi:acylphosphatase
MATVCKRVLYAGRVQGVGFRYTTHAIARGYAIAGHVRNLSDGRVEVVAEGEETALAAFLNAVRDHWSGYITEAVEGAESPRGLTGFSIRH